MVCQGVDWIHLAEDSGRYRALEDTVMNIRVPLNVSNFVTHKKLL
jgi:hypothetical protein